VERQQVSSSNIAAIGYDAVSETLEVEFTNGTIYQYYGIGAQLHEQLMNAPSKGQFLNANIRNQYAYSRVG
jgi:hypothetical protein